MIKSPELDNLPLLTDVVAVQPVDDLPTLTEIVTPTVSSVQEYITTLSLDEPLITLEATPPVVPLIDEVIAAPPKLIAELSEEQLQQLLSKLQHRLEGKFMQQLAPQIAQLQKHAFEQALSELRNELPTLLRNALTITETNK